MSNLYQSPHEFIFKSDFDLGSDLSTLLYKTQYYKESLKSPCDFWEKELQDEQQEKIDEVNNYITNLYRLIDCLIERRF